MERQRVGTRLVGRPPVEVQRADVQRVELQRAELQRAARRLAGV